MRLYCVGDEDTVRGFRLAGIEGRVVTSAFQAAVAVEEVARRKEVGVLILTEDVATAIREQVEAIRLEQERPLIVEVPGPSGPAPARRRLRQIVQAAVGINVRPEEDA